MPERVVLRHGVAVICPSVGVFQSCLHRFAIIRNRPNDPWVTIALLSADQSFVRSGLEQALSSCMIENADVVT